MIFFFTETTVVHNYENMLAAFIVIQAMKGSKQSSLHGPMILVDPIHFSGSYPLYVNPNLSARFFFAYNTYSK